MSIVILFTDSNLTINITPHALIILLFTSASQVVCGVLNMSRDVHASLAELAM